MLTVDADGQPAYPEPVRLQRLVEGVYRTEDDRFEVFRDPGRRSTWLIYDLADPEDPDEPVYVVTTLREARHWLAGHYVPSA
jgi:hypothetical protein